MNGERRGKKKEKQRSSSASRITHPLFIRIQLQCSPPFFFERLHTFGMWRKKEEKNCKQSQNPHGFRLSRLPVSYKQDSLQPLIENKEKRERRKMGSRKNHVLGTGNADFSLVLDTTHLRIYLTQSENLLFHASWISGLCFI